MKIVTMGNSIYSTSGLFIWNRRMKGWVFKGSCDDEGSVDHDETVVARRLLADEIAKTLKELNDEGGPEEEDDESWDDEIIPATPASLYERMKEYDEEFRIMDSVSFNEYGISVSINWADNSYKAQVHCDDDLKQKIMGKHGSKPSDGIEKELIMLECGKDKKKVIALAIHQIEKFSLWIATL